MSKREEIPYLKAWKYLGIHSLKPITKGAYFNKAYNIPTIKVERDHEYYRHQRKPGRISPLETDESHFVYRLPATHILTLCSNNWHWCFKSPSKRSTTKHKNCGQGRFERITKTWVDGVDLSDPNQDACMIIWARRKVLGRNTGCNFIYYNNVVYHVLTWYDIVGSNKKQSGLNRVVNKRLTLFVRERSQEDTQKFIDLFKKEEPEYRKH
jgi:hypothetical protein